MNELLGYGVEYAIKTNAISEPRSPDGECEEIPAGSRVRNQIILTDKGVLLEGIPEFSAYAENSGLPVGCNAVPSIAGNKVFLSDGSIHPAFKD